MGLIDLFAQKKSDNNSDNNLLKIAAVGLPILLMALKKKNENTDNLESLKETLARHENKSDGNILERIQNADTEDGSKILNHILGGEKESVVEKISKMSGVETDEVKKVLEKLSPSILEELAEETRNNRTADSVKELTEQKVRQIKDKSDANNWSLAGSELLSTAIDFIGGLFN